MKHMTEKNEIYKSESDKPSDHFLCNIIKHYL